MIKKNEKDIINLIKKNITYKEGFYTKLISDELSSGLNEQVIRAISEKKCEPDWMLKFRLHAYHTWLNMKEPHWLKAYYPNINYNSYSYYSAPKHKGNEINNKKIDNYYLTNEVKQTFDKLGIPTKEINNIAIDAVFDSVSVSTTYQKELLKYGIIFCSLSFAINHYPELVRKYLGSVVPVNDNFFAALNSAVLSDGTFIYIPKGVKCPIELSTYFRINSMNTGQFERTIIIADKDSYVSYIEGCSAPIRKNYQLHAAVVEIIILDNAIVKYSTIQNWFSGINHISGILNFVTKRALCIGNNSKMSWVQSETGSAITWKYPSIILKGNNTVGEFYSIALTNMHQCADTGTKMIHLGNNTNSTIISKSIASGYSKNTYRGLVKVNSNANNSRNYTQCHSIMIGNKCSTYTFPDIQINNNTSQVEHEALTSSIGENQLFYLNQRGINNENAISMIISGFCQDIFTKLPLEFAIEAKKLLSINLDEGLG
ncbi:MAG: Fe-S cluster assembly protein SufB [Candidatus Lightella neohaematopini]|nr:Fe-S cluster assembly protein SufB [Candidatus Lightella neohaematopini]MCV2528881.1 Fe-S cluster assembly protein SufB [Candidatus Lightella neohaematopini]